MLNLPVNCGAEKQMNGLEELKTERRVRGRESILRIISREDAKLAKQSEEIVFYCLPLRALRLGEKSLLSG